jgi:hypothetical protein
MSRSHRRFISPDTVVQNPLNPQTLYRYSHFVNNPLKYTDPSGHSPVWWLNGLYACYTTGLIDKQGLSLALLVSNGPLAIGTALHEIAQVNAAQALSQEYGPATLEYNIGGSREADIMIGGQAWEVKPWGQSPETQLKYDKSLGLLERGDNTRMLNRPISEIPIIGDIKMDVTFGDPGEIYYSLYKTGRNGDRVTVSFWEVCWELCWRPVCATAIVIGIMAATLGEDISTYGAGVGNDIIAWQLAMQRATEILDLAGGGP